MNNAAFLDISSDGEWILTINSLNNKAYLYHYEFGYKLYQEPLNFDDMSKITAGFIEKNIMIIGKDNG